MRPSDRRFNREFLPLADAIARLDIPQEIREQVATALTDALMGRPDFQPSKFRLLASDPLNKCIGYGDHPCPDGIEIRTAMHLSSAPDGRSAMWAETPPIVRCTLCGSTEFLGLPRRIGDEP